MGSSTRSEVSQQAALLPLPPNAMPIQSKAKKFSHKEMEERRAKGLCFHCDDKFSPGYKCPKKQQLLIEMEDPKEEGIELGKEQTEDEATNLRISIHDLFGELSCQTMRVTGMVGKCVLHILVNSGSTHNFLNVATEQLLSCQTTNISPIKVVVANGTELVCNSVCKGFEWRMQGYECEADVFLLTLESYDMVLGI